MSKRELQIDESFQYELLTLKCIENPNKKGLNTCLNCYFYNLPCWYMADSTGECNSRRREDRKNVIFIKVEETK